MFPYYASSDKSIIDSSTHHIVMLLFFPFVINTQCTKFIVGRSIRSAITIQPRMNAHKVRNECRNITTNCNAISSNDMLIIYFHNKVLRNHCRKINVKICDEWRWKYLKTNFSFYNVTLSKKPDPKKTHHFRSFTFFI